ncbi:DUF2630 family protein [Caenimonas soli]|uniref:DUF2630 family protein n=1 Tax=Caenimonas soli TaxID=2735555 RepID=UPI00155586EC|nr:DUF2630 family protein [Caenimonas soli]NPC58449.1 DUF2630 family protein [Caenimonas soli]
MSDKSILKNITELVDEERVLRDDGTASEDKSTRLRHVSEELDQCWDLLRQRRALREFGRNPDDAKPRDASVVEGYLN